MSDNEWVDAPTPQAKSQADDGWVDAPQGKIGDGLAAAVPDGLKSLIGMQHAFRGNLVKGASLGNLSGPPGTEEASEAHPIAAAAGHVGGGLAFGGASGAALPIAGSALGRIAAGGAEGGAVAGLSKPGGEDGLMARLKAVPRGVATGLISSTLGEGISKLLTGSANRSMKRAVGITGAKSKNAPQDIGNTLVDEGLIGSKARMADQADAKYGEVENQIQKLAKDTPGEASGDAYAAKVEDLLSRRMDPTTGKVMPGREPEVSAINQRAEALRYGGQGGTKGTADSVKDRIMIDSDGERHVLGTVTTPGTPAQVGKYNAESLLAHKRSGDWDAFTNSGTPATSGAAEIGRAQGDGARSLLADLSKGAMPAALKREQALILADKSLRTPDMTSKSPMTFSDLASGIMASSSGGLPGALGGVLTSKAALMPAVQSTYAHAAQNTGKAAGSPTTQLALQALLASIFNRK